MATDSYQMDKRDSETWKEAIALRKALDFAVLQIVTSQDVQFGTRTTPSAIRAMSELTWQYLQHSLRPDLHAFSDHGNRKSTIAVDDVALVLRKMPDKQEQLLRAVGGTSAVTAARKKTPPKTLHRPSTASGIPPLLSSDEDDDEETWDQLVSNKHARSKTTSRPSPKTSPPPPVAPSSASPVGVTSPLAVSRTSPPSSAKRNSPPRKKLAITKTATSHLDRARQLLLESSSDDDMDFWKNTKRRSPHSPTSSPVLASSLGSNGSQKKQSQPAKSQVLEIMANLSSCSEAPDYDGQDSNEDEQPESRSNDSLTRRPTSRPNVFYDSQDDED